MELPDIRSSASADPRGFLALHAPPAIFDEVQYAAELLPYIKERIDAHRAERGQYLLIGSQNLQVMERVTESLAGRAATLRLLPLSTREAFGYAYEPLPWERDSGPRPRGDLTYLGLWKVLVRGGYPELVVDPVRDAALWHASYTQTYFERDVRLVRQVGDLTQFQNFLRALSARCGQLLNLSELARDLGLAVNTARAWLSVLEASFQIIVLRPYFGNVGKRLVKTPKVYFMDTGTLCYLCGLRDPEHAAAGPMGGAVFENAVLIEVTKALLNRGEEPQIYFWRTSAGSEVDIVLQIKGNLIPIEVKLSATPRASMADSIATFRRDFGRKAAKGYLVHPGDIRLPVTPDVLALPFAEF